MTLIIMLILAGISLSGLIGGKGLFKRTEDASNIYNEKKAREVLETVLLTDGQYEKNTNPEYNEEEFLNKLIKEEIPGSDVRGDVAIIGGEYAYDLDRSVPKIGIRGNNGYLGNPKDLVWPEVVIISEPTLIENGRKARFKIKATIDEKATKGITRIELWLNGKKLNQDREYENEPREVEEEYIVNRNGVYTIKAYAELMGSNKTTVEGIVPTVIFSPDGSTEWKKQHTTTVTVEETGETITGMKYLWVKNDGVNEPDVTLFKQNCPSDGVIMGGNNTMTGTYYLWILLTIGKGETKKTSMYASQGFNFDNEGPTINEDFNSTDDLSFYAKMKITDTHSGLENYSVLLDGVSVISENVNGASVNESRRVMCDCGKHLYEITAIDVLGNVSKIVGTIETKPHSTYPYISGTINVMDYKVDVKFRVTSYGCDIGEVTCSGMNLLETDKTDNKNKMYHFEHVYSDLDWHSIQLRATDSLGLVMTGTLRFRLLGGRQRFWRGI